MAEQPRTDGVDRVSGHSPYALRATVQDGVLVVVFDLPGSPVNKFNRQVKDEFVALFEQIERDSSLIGAVLLSGKEDTWIAGADIEEFLELRTVESAERMSLEGQALLNRLEGLRIPVVAAIHGACVGGGLEAALACRWRIATDHPKTVLSLPEIQLGLIPGAGGTQRLPKVVGVSAALDMILTGRKVRSARALRIGLVHEVVHPAILRDLAIRRARELAGRSAVPPGAPRKRRGSALQWFLDKTPIGRTIVFRRAREESAKQTKGNYPAAGAAIKAVEGGFAIARADALRAEAMHFGEMAMTPVCRELIYVFFASNELKRDVGVGVPVQPSKVRRIGVLGGGFMGAGIAALAAASGLAVRLKDADNARLGRGFASIRKLADERLRKGHITRTDFENELSLVTGTTSYTGFGRVQLVIEAVFEELAVKQQVLREVERVLPEEAIFASNTSTIPIREIAKASARPDRVVGMHFFSPVHRMPLLEVVAPQGADAEAIAAAVACGKELGKTVIVVADSPGFYVNRILGPYLNEAGILLDQGARIQDIDRAMVNYGFPVGPVTLLDEVGLDIAAKGGEVLAAAFGSRFSAPRIFEGAVAAGRYGRKNGRGFYRYSAAGEREGVDESVYQLSASGARRTDFTAAEIQQRLVLAMLNEAARTLEEGIIRSPRDGNIGAVFGIGFPPFLGGPFRYMNAVGLPTLADQMEELNQRFPGRFEPADILSRMARAGELFTDPEG